MCREDSSNILGPQIVHIFVSWGHIISPFPVTHFVIFKKKLLCGSCNSVCDIVLVLCSSPATKFSSSNARQNYCLCNQTSFSVFTILLRNRNFPVSSIQVSSPNKALHIYSVWYSSLPVFHGAEAIEEQLESALEEVVKRNFAANFTKHMY